MNYFKIFGKRFSSANKTIKFSDINKDIKYTKHPLEIKTFQDKLREVNII